MSREEKQFDSLNPLEREIVNSLIGLVQNYNKSVDDALENNILSNKEHLNVCNIYNALFEYYKGEDRRGVLFKVGEEAYEVFEFFFDAERQFSHFRDCLGDLLQEAVNLNKHWQVRHLVECGDVVAEGIICEPDANPLILKLLGKEKWGNPKTIDYHINSLPTGITRQNVASLSCNLHMRRVTYGNSNSWAAAVEAKPSQSPTPSP